MAENPSPVPPQGWAVKGNCYNYPGVMTDMTIPEKGHCIAMPGYQGPYGSPIDAKLAVSLIQNFHRSFRVMQSGPPLIKSEEQVKNMKPEELMEYAHKSRKVHYQLSKLNYGMTIDKNLALKFLSQPGCEGLRFYLCSRSNPHEHISLVVVGVDCNGKDLNYETTSVTRDTSTVGEKLSINDDPPVDINNESLNGEYVTPPFSDNDNSSIDHILLGNETGERSADLQAFLDCFVLLNIATGAVKPKP